MLITNELWKTQNDFCYENGTRTKMLPLKDHSSKVYKNYFGCSLFDRLHLRNNKARHGIVCVNEKLSVAVTVKVTKEEFEEFKRCIELLWPGAPVSCSAMIRHLAKRGCSAVQADHQTRQHKPKKE